MKAENGIKKNKNSNEITEYYNAAGQTRCIIANPSDSCKAQADNQSKIIAAPQCSILTIIILTGNKDF